MGVTSDDLFGEGDQPVPALPGTYGVPPAAGRLPDAVRLGPVRLQVADLGRSLAWYTQVLGLQEIARGVGRASLAPSGTSRMLIDLVERPGCRRADGRPHLGLYHFAILLPDRAALGRFVRHLSTVGVRAGAADHLVSEAFYLTDPDGLGVEVYADRPRSSWRRQGRELMMATDPVDVRELLRAAEDDAWSGMPEGTVMGHVHLHVGDTERAGTFYGDTVGFDRMVWRYPGALFLAAGGYHHHLGTNTWAGPAATPPRDDEAQLLAWTIELPTATDVDLVRARLAAAGAPVDTDGDGATLLRDPWGTAVAVRQVPA